LVDFGTKTVAAYWDLRCVIHIEQHNSRVGNKHTHYCFKGTVTPAQAGGAVKSAPPSHIPTMMHMATAHSASLGANITTEMLGVYIICQSFEAVQKPNWEK
jgi:hypothetical protein